MNRRKLLPIALVSTALYAAVVVATASAELHQVRVTLVTGQVLTMTVDVPPGGTASASHLPGLPAPVQSIEDLGPIAVEDRDRVLLRDVLRAARRRAKV